MATHYGAIGIPLDSLDEYVDMVELAIKSSETIDCEDGCYLRWRSSEGAELWIYADRDGCVLTGSPYFRGKSRVSMVLRGDAPRDGAVTGEGAVWGHSDTADGDGSQADLRLVFDLVDRARHGPIAYPLKCVVQLSAFAHELRIYSSEDEYCASVGGPILTDDKHIIPCGILPSPGEPMIEFTGWILEAAKYTNPLVGGQYYWVLVRVGAAQIDVVCEPAFVGQSPVAGGMLDGRFWLCGSIMESS